LLESRVGRGCKQQTPQACDKTAVVCSPYDTICCPTIQQSFHNPDQALKGSLGRSPAQQRKFFMQQLTKKNEVAPGAQNNAVAVANDFVQSKRANRFLNVFNDLAQKNPSGNLRMSPECA
jgi:hypothetical protein